jgi:hypothetical protein
MKKLLKELVKFMQKSFIKKAVESCGKKIADKLKGDLISFARSKILAKFNSRLKKK